MRAVVQRVASARVEIAGTLAGAIDRGLVVLLGIARGDTAEDGAWLAAKIVRLRLFDDEDGRMNLSVLDRHGGVLAVSQFTLLGDVRKGTRPSWNDAAPPAEAEPLYELFLRQLAAELGQPPAAGRFGAMMQVHLVNDGPVTLILDTRK
jgi:D-tyrosyl-tRNA(Tyr) deacylase